jgi:hypothetical protein
LQVEPPGGTRRVHPSSDARSSRVVEGLTPETIRDAARQYIDTERYVRVTLLPETPTASN